MRRLRQATWAVLAYALLSFGPGLPVSAASIAAAASCPLIVRNGSFEAQGANWTQAGASGIQLITDLNARAGSYSADLGGANNTDHSIRQQIVLPSKRPVTLTFWWEQWTQETAPGDFADYMTVNLLKADGSLLKEVARLGVDPERPPWERLSVDLSAYAGQTVQLQFLAHNDSTNPTEFFVDDVTIPGCRTYLPSTRR